VATKKDLIIAVLAAFCLTATLFMIAPTSSVPARQYDPWLDYNGDGKIELKDVYAMYLAYGTSGDPIKNVNVTNWPIDKETVVWFNTSFQYWGPYSQEYSSKGYGHLHIAILVIPDYVHGPAWDDQHFGWVSLNTTFRNPSNPQKYFMGAVFSVLFKPSKYPLWYYNVTIPVPAETFFFSAGTAHSTVVGYICLKFYLTYA
jgi:hypothetical protein